MRFAVVSVLSALAFAAGSAHAGDNAVIDTKAPCEKPAYPRASLVNEEQGTVVIGLLVGTDGAVADSKVEKSSGFKNLDKAAQKALAACKFKPAAGKPEWQKIEYAWQLQ